MDGQVLGGGVIVLVAVLLWLVYLLPSWNARHQYNASERNAVRLNQALRILAETSETPGEVQLELNARTALAQQKLARRVQADREALELEELRLTLETQRHALEVQRQSPAARRARGRRRARMTATAILVAGLGLIGWGVWQTVQAGSQVMLWSGVATSLAAVLVLQRMTSVQVRAARRAADAEAAAAASASVVATVSELQDVELVRDPSRWTPRPLPRPLVTAEGSRAAAELAAADAREALRRAAQEEAMRDRIERTRPAPTPITTAARTEPARPAAEFSAMGVVDDAEIEAHVRTLLRRRAVGE